jgi:hypothetical protein
LRCLYCGKEYWLPSQIRRDSDFCSLPHREKYHNRFERAMARLQESSALPNPELAPTPVAETPPAPTPPGETRPAPSRTTASTSPSPLPVNSVPNSYVVESLEPAPASPAARPSSIAERFQPQLKNPRLEVRPIFERLEEVDQSPYQRDGKGLESPEIFSTTAVAPFPWQKVPRPVVTAVAAAVAVTMVLWFGVHAGRYGRDLLNKGSARMAASSYSGSGAAGTMEMASTPALTARPMPSAFQDPVAWVQRAAAKRASRELAESFDNGMKAWGVQGWASGWSRSSEGYVRPGQLALFQPTLRYADYRMDFFGQIEAKSMSWVVRGKDPENYYAMRITVVKPGLRPVISMAHYPVVGGKEGHKVEVPLSVMMHNNTPYRISVEVKGSHYTASIEGEEIDSWSDETLLAGGVGFFSEAGARARIYWMKVTKNDDWLGRICDRIAGSAESPDTAWLAHPLPLELPPERTAPVPGSTNAMAMRRIEPTEAPSVVETGSERLDNRWGVRFSATRDGRAVDTRIPGIGRQHSVELGDVQVGIADRRYSSPRDLAPSRSPAHRS